MTKDTGGAAFPQITELGDIAQTSNGMTLRDWFAGKALQGILGNPNISNKFFEDDAHVAYKCADAMLAERAKG